MKDKKSRKSKKQIEKCRYYTNKGTRCKNRAIDESGFCIQHKIKTSSPGTKFVIGLLISFILLIFGIVITPQIERWVRPTKTLNEIIKTEGDNAIKIKDRKLASIYAHKLHDFGVQAIHTGDYDAYHQAIWQMLRLLEFCLTSNWRNDPTTPLVRNEVSSQLILLIAEKPLPLMERVMISKKLEDFPLLGTEASLANYNHGIFFSDLLFTEALDVFRRTIDTLWMRKNYHLAGMIAECMQNAIFAEAHRKLDQGYRICPIPDDIPQITIGVERVADVGQPRELDSYYKACYIMSKLQEPLFKSFIDNAKYHRLRRMRVIRDEKVHSMSVAEVVDSMKYYHPRAIFVPDSISDQESLLLDSLVAACNKQAQEAAECVKQLVKRERYQLWKKD